LRAQGFVTTKGRQTRIAQQFRVIKRTLIDYASQRDLDERRHARRIMITSANPGEGKTFCAINLAIAFSAERDLRVLLVDADFANPSVMKTLGLEAGPGLMEWLQSDVESTEGLIVPTNIGGLSLLPSGKGHSHATELLSSKRTARRLAQLDSLLKNYIVVFDSAPLLLSTESLALSRHMGQVVLVVEADKTLRRTVEEASALLSDHPGVSVLLNKQKSEGGSKTSGYGNHGYRAR
jgi:protein-tyrosine kinase